MAAPVRALFFLGELGGGGAESHTVRVVNHLPRDRVRPEIAVCRRDGSYQAFVRGDVPVHDVSVSVPSSLGRLALGGLGLRRLVERTRPDVVVAVMDAPGLVALSALRGSRDPKIVVCVQIPPSIEYARSRVGRALLLPGIARLYPRADRIIALSSGVAADLAAIEPSLASLTTVIHNACVDERAAAEAIDESLLPQASVPVLLAAGRLTYQKGYPVLIEAFARIAQRTSAELWILGEGPDRQAIEDQVRRLGLHGRVRMPGFVDNPAAYMRRATAFVLSSHYEGFGNVIVEALACGTPVVSTDCPHGPREILEGERGGVLVPPADPSALAEALLTVLDDPVLRGRLAAAGRSRSADFSASRVAARYATELESVRGERGASSRSRPAVAGE
jgi:glycosyltransferase involved in cell wall biosynthesis